MSIKDWGADGMNRDCTWQALLALTIAAGLVGCGGGGSSSAADGAATPAATTGSTGPVPSVGGSTSIAPADPVPTGSDNGCGNLAKYEAPGHRVDLTYVYSGDSHIYSTELVYGDMVMFNGHLAREVVDTTSVSNVATKSVSRTYSNHTGEGEITLYGYVLANQQSTFYTPPVVNREYRLGAGESFSGTMHASYSVPATSTSPAQTGTFTTDFTYTYVGREMLTVPAGTFETCKFVHALRSVSSDGSILNTTMVNWILVGEGLLLQNHYSSGNGIDRKVTSITINGRRL